MDFLAAHRATETSRRSSDRLSGWWIVLVSVVILLFVLAPLARPGFPDNNDGPLYPSWLYEYDTAIHDGVLLPRWAPNVWWGYGSPLFLYLQPAFFATSEAWHLLGSGLGDAIKITIGFSIVLGFVAMYLLTAHHWGRWFGLLAANLYLLAPYRLALIYRRGAFAEYLAFSLLPLILWSFTKLAETGRRIYLVISAVSLATLLLTHNITALFGLPVVFAYILIVLRPWRLWRSIVQAVIGGLGLSAFFWIPAFFERNAIVTERFTAGAHIFSTSFVSLLDYIAPYRTDWTFIWIGYAGTLILVLSIYALIRRRSQEPARRPALFGLALMVVAVFMTTTASRWLWESIQTLQFTLFVWRLAGFVALGLALNIGLLASLWDRWRFPDWLPSRWTLPLAVMTISVLALFGSRAYLRPIEQLAPLPDGGYQVAKVVRVRAIKALTHGTLSTNVFGMSADYLPRSADESYVLNVIGAEMLREIVLWSGEGQPPFPPLSVIEGDATALPIRLKSNDRAWTVTATGTSQIKLNTFSFPGWRLTLDGKTVEPLIVPKEGTMQVQIPPGEHTLTLRLAPTTLQRVSIWVSIGSFMGLVLVSLVRRRKTRVHFPLHG